MSFCTPGQCLRTMSWSCPQPVLGRRKGGRAESSELSSDAARSPGPGAGPVAAGRRQSHSSHTGRGRLLHLRQEGPWQHHVEWSPALSCLAPSLKSLGSGRRAPPVHPASGLWPRPQNSLSCPFSLNRSSSSWASWPQLTLGTKPQWGKGLSSLTASSYTIEKMNQVKLTITQTSSPAF